MGAAEVGAEALLAEVEDPLMVPAVAGDLMAGHGRPADQGRMALGDPAQSEEGRLDPGLGEQVEHRFGVAPDALLQPVPLVAADHFLEGADLEPVLDVDGEGVQHSTALSDLFAPSPVLTGEEGPKRSLGGEGL